MFKHIVTLALCPTLDTTIWLDGLKKGKENQADEERYDASGKAVNLSRIFTEYGVENECILLLGKENKTRFVGQLDRENIKYQLIEVDGYTRENLSLVEQDGSVTRIIRKGFTVNFETIEKVVESLDKLVTAETLVMISGRLPEGISVNTLKNLCDRIKAKGGTVSLDSQSVGMQDTLSIAPWIIKPNLEEFEKLTGRDFEGDYIALAKAAQELCGQGIGRILISLGADGLLYVEKDQVLRVEVPEVLVKSTVGAGDSVLAGFVRSQLCGYTVERSVATAAAFGTAACMIDGSQPPHKLTVGNVLQQVEVTPVEL